jgi:HEAT repeat protein
MKKYGFTCGILALIAGALVLAGIALLIFALKGTSLRYTIDGLVIDSPRWELKAAVTSGDSVNILRAFTKATYRPVWAMSEAIPTMRSYLNDPNPLVRCYAAKALYTFGDQGGHDALLDLLQTDHPMVYFEHDLRIDAIETLTKYRQADAAQSILSLYDKADDKELFGRQLRGAIRVGLMMLAPNLAKGIMIEGYFNEASAIKDYGLLDDQNYLPQISASFQNSQKLDVKIAASWAIATMTSDRAATDYLIQTAQAMVNEQHSPFEMREMIKFLGSIQDTRVKPVLEQALNSDDPSVVQSAIVNLQYNQGGSDKAIQVLAKQFNDTAHATLPWDFTLQVASQFRSDPRIQEAGDRFAGQDVMQSWQLWTGDRQKWPIYNWIDEYVVKLNVKK